jgi:hypothetical protein
MSNHLYDIFGNLIDQCIINFVKSPNISDLVKMSTSEYSMLCFRTYYYFYVICKYTHELTSNNDNQHQQWNIDDLRVLFFQYYDHCADKIDEVNREMLRHLRDTLDQRFNYLYETFFIHENMYFNTYFNNLIKYFLPLPYKLLNHGIIITYRKDVKQICRNDDIDYLETINKTDFIKQRTFVKAKNIDAIKKELSFHLPIKYFSSNLFTNNLFLIACKSGSYGTRRKYLLVIGKKLVHHPETDTWKCDLMYTRDYDGINEKLMREGMSFEVLFNKWKRDTRVMTLRDIIYINVLKKLNDVDLFNVFPKIDLPYTKLYHNTGLTMTQEIAKEKLQYPTFFYPDISGYSEYFKDRKCIIYNVIKPLNQIIDTTRSIITFNPMVNDSKTLDVACSINKKDQMDKLLSLSQYLEQRPDCDINDQCHYTGRRKLQEILFKTRKYDASKIWIYEFSHQRLSELLSININDLYNNLYHHPLKNQIGTKISDYDSLILGDIGISGFFSTDYHRVWDKGGEVMLTDPSVHLEIDRFMDKMCFEINTTDQKYISESKQARMHGQEQEKQKQKQKQKQTLIKKEYVKQCDDPDNLPDEKITFPLMYSDKLNNMVNQNIKHLIIGNRYKIIGSYNKKRLITDIDITNFVNHTESLRNNLQKMISDLPDNITFVYMTLGTKYNINDLMTIDWTKSSQKKIVIESVDHQKINEIETSFFSSKDKIRSLIDKDIFHGYMFLRDNAKIKWSEKEINQGFKICEKKKYDIREMLKSNNPILHFIMDYDDSFIIFDVAMKYGNIEQKYISSGFLTYYNHEWFYILEDLSRSVDANTNPVTKQQMLERLEQYNGIKQILMQLYYLEYMVLHNLITNVTKFVNYFTYLIFGATQIIGNNQIIDVMKECVHSVKTKQIDITDPMIYEHVHAFNHGLFAKINNDLKKDVLEFIELMDHKPKYYHLI